MAVRSRFIEVDTPEGAAKDRSRARYALAVRWLAAGMSLAGFVALVVLAVLVATQTNTPSLTSTGGGGPPPLGAGAIAPAFSLPRLGGGEPVSLALAGGRPVIINFFASWCTDCQQELAAFAAASKQLAGKVEFIGVDTSETDPSAALALLRRAGDHYPTGTEAGETVADLYLVGALPETFYVDAGGHLRAYALGRQTVGDLLMGASALLDRAGT